MSRKRRFFNEFNKIEREIDQFIDEVMDIRPMWNTQYESLEPLAFMQESNDKIIITLDLPFVDKDNIDLDVTPKELKLEAKMQRCVVYEKWGTIQRHCKFKTLYKSIKLPVEVVPEMAKAKFKGGYLTVELPKKTKRFKITVE